MYQVDTNTVSLLHFNDGIKDETGKVWTAEGNISVNKDQKKFGNGSLLCNNGLLSYLDTKQEFVFGTSDFTIECWVYITEPSSITYGMPVVGNCTYSTDGYSGNSGWVVFINRSMENSSDSVGLGFRNHGASGALNIDVTYKPMIEAKIWHHIAVVKTRKTINLFLDGKLVANQTTDASIDIAKPYAYIGNYNTKFGRNYPKTALYGYIDELRVSKVARWTSDFTPSAPINLAATAGDSKVTLLWTAVDGATSYNVKRSTTSGGTYTTIASNVTDTSYVDSSVTNGTTYYYVVTAVNTYGESVNSNEVSATPESIALLRITMNDSSEREYRLNSTEIDAFINWYTRTVGTGTTCYTFNDTIDKSKEYLAFEKIISFKVIPTVE